MSSPTIHCPIDKAKARLEDIEDLAGTGENMLGVARRLRSNPVAVERFLYRYGRGDLVARLKAETVGHVRRGHNHAREIAACVAG